MTEDIHTQNAAASLGIPESEVTPEQRRDQKAIDFGRRMGLHGVSRKSLKALADSECRQKPVSYGQKLIKATRSWHGVRKQKRQSIVELLRNESVMWAGDTPEYSKALTAAADLLAAYDLIAVGEVPG